MGTLERKTPGQDLTNDTLNRTFGYGKLNIDVIPFKTMDENTMRITRLDYLKLQRFLEENRGNPEINNIMKKVSGANQLSSGFLQYLANINESKGLKYERSKDFSKEPKRIKLPDKHVAEVRLPIESDQDPLERQRLQALVLDGSKQQFYADLVSLGYIYGVMNNERLTGENESGAFYSGNNTLIVRDLTFKTVKSVLENVVNSGNLQYLFKRLD